MKKIRARTCDISIKLRMGAGYPGEVNRTHPVDINPELADSTNPPTLAGQGVLIDATSHAIRKLITGDGTSSISLYGITVRTFPFQQATTSNNYGAVAIGNSPLPIAGEVDILRRGTIIVQVPTGQSPVKGGAVYIWNAASTGVHVQGSFESVSTGGSTATISNAIWNSGVDASGYAELAFNI